MTLAERTREGLDKNQQKRFDYFMSIDASAQQIITFMRQQWGYAGGINWVGCPKSHLAQAYARRDHDDWWRSRIAAVLNKFGLRAKKKFRRMKLK